MKYIITKAYNQGDWFIKDFSLISVTDEFKNKLREIINYIKSAPSNIFDSVEVTEYNFGFLYFYDSTSIEYLEDAERNNDINTIEAWAVNGQGCDSVIEIENINNLICIEGEVSAYLPKCVVSSGGLSFYAQNKYGDEEEMWTDHIPFQTILNF